MQMWIGFDASLADVEWLAPPDSALSRAQLVDQHRLYARLEQLRPRRAEEEELPPCRRVRAMLGHKAPAS
jgi:hypothetical protein